MKTKKNRSIMQADNRHCFLCMELDQDDQRKYPLQCHHIFGGANRKLSDDDGLMVYLCWKHHGSFGPYDVHNTGANDYMDYLHVAGQFAWMKKVYGAKHPDSTEGERAKAFVQRYGKNYIMDLADEDCP